MSDCVSRRGILSWKKDRFVFMLSLYPSSMLHMDTVIHSHPSLLCKYANEIILCERRKKLALTLPEVATCFTILVLRPLPLGFVYRFGGFLISGRIIRLTVARGTVAASLPSCRLAVVGAFFMRVKSSCSCMVMVLVFVRAFL